MGIDTDLIIGTVPNGLECAICTSLLQDHGCHEFRIFWSAHQETKTLDNLLQDAVTLKQCQHNYCRLCLNQLAETNIGTTRCPECRESFSMDSDVIELRFIRNLLSSLKLKCHDCKAEVMYDNFDDHLFKCGFDLIQIKPPLLKV